MIYSGEDSGSVTDANRTGETTQIGTSAFNEQYNDNAYVGYMYGTPRSDTYKETHANINDSTIKEILDTWYQNNLLSYADKISTEQGFCNDRRIATSTETWWRSDTKLGYGANSTAYAPFSRFLTTNNTWNSMQNPSLKCSQSNDLFTVIESSKGNHALIYPVGLITADEVVLAGGFGGINNSNFYLYTNLNYWTMSPSDYGSYGRADIFYVSLDGNFYSFYVTDIHGIRPVINLSPNVTITGSGTTSDPYKVQ